jgi:hypothetical protein
MRQALVTDMVNTVALTAFWERDSLSRQGRFI